MKYKIGYKYADPCGRGIFFLNKDDTVSWGHSENNLIFDDEATALLNAQAANRPNTDDNWQPFPIA